MGHTKYTIFSILIILMGCLSVKINTKSQDGFFINNYNTYNYNIDHYSLADTTYKMNQDLDYFKEKLDDLLNSSGLFLAEKPELLLNVDVVYEERRQAKSGRDTGYDKSYVGDIKPDRNSGEYVTVNYDIGTITVEFVDIKKNEVVFHGTAVGIDTKNGRKTRERIGETVEKMFLDMPKK